LRVSSRRTDEPSPYSISFSATIVPFPTICLASAVAALAIDSGGLKTSFGSIHELFHRPVLGSVDYIPLPWKDEWLEKPLLDITYQIFNSL